ncbi:MAG: hypothetical protein ABIY55_10350 [Kofleriaceae bacterium]
MTELGRSRTLRLLRIYLLACIAISFAYLVLHVREPLRLNVGDPWSDAETASSVQHLKQSSITTPLVSDVYREAHDPLTGLVYGAMAKLGISDLGTFRLFALGFSMLWVWLVLLYARRIWGDTVALLATALLATSVLWMMYADSIDRPPIVHASCFLALWGVASAIEIGQRRHYAAAIIGSFGCLFGGFDDWGLLLAGVLFTVYIKRGHPFARGNRRFVMICAVGAVAAILSKSLLVGRYADSVEWQAAMDRALVTFLPTLLRRYALVFTPMFWITFGYTTWNALRAPSLTSVIEDGRTWLLAVAMLVLYVASPDTASPMLRAQPVLPFYAIGTAILLARLLEGRRLARSLALAWAAVAPAWGLYLMLSHPRSVLDREDVARTRAYFATNDGNDFVMSNLLSDGPIHASFDRHSWPALQLDNEANTHVVLLQMLNVFDTTGADYVHAVIFTTSESRFVDRSLAQLVVPGKLASVTGWPYLVRSKANGAVRDYDERVRRYLEAVGAKQVLHLSNFDVYRIDRTTVLEVISRSIPVVRAIDFSSPGANKYKLLGWSAPWVTEADQLGVTSIIGHVVCSNPVLHRSDEPAGNACETVLTPSGLNMFDAPGVARAQLMIRVERACDLRLTVELASSSLENWASKLASPFMQPALALVSSTRLGISVNDFTATQCEPGKRVSFVIPQRSVQDGVNIVTLERKRFGPVDPRVDLVSLAIEPLCELAR